MSRALLIENGTVFTGGKTASVLPNHSVLIENGFITRVAPSRKMTQFSGRRINAAGKLVAPGFINAHTHFYSTFARGLTGTQPCRDFRAVLKNLWWRLDSALTTEDCYYSALITLLDSIRHGTTTLFDHHASPNAARGSLTAIARAVEETGLRACLCYEVSDRDGARIAAEGMEENLAFIRNCQEAGGKGAGCQVSGDGESRATRNPQPATRSPHLAALFGLHAAFTLKDSTLAKAAAMGRESAVGFHVHVAEARSDQDDSQSRHGLRVVERLNRFGILGPQTIAAHCVHVNAREMELLAGTGTAVVHNPQSNMNNAVGVADVLALNRNRVLVGLGTDAMTANMLEELRAAVWAQRLAADNPSVGFSEAVTALVANNPEIARRAFALPLGELREGFAGDVVIFDYDPPTPLETQNSFGHLVFGLSQTAVDTTIVGGNILMENRRLALNLDEERLNARARELARDLWKRLPESTGVPAGEFPRPRSRRRGRRALASRTNL